MLDGIWARAKRIGSAERVLKLLLVLSVIGPAVVLLLVTLQSRGILLDAATQRATRTSEMLARHAASIFDSYNLALGRVGEHMLRAEGPFQEKALHDYLSEIDREMKSADGIVVIDETWRSVAHSRNYPVHRIYLGDRDYIRTLQAPTSNAEKGRNDAMTGREGLIVGAPVKSRYSGRIVIVVSRARRGVDGRLEGAMILALSQSYFDDFYRSLALSPGDRVALVRADGRVLAQMPPVPGQMAVDSDAVEGATFTSFASAPREPLKPGLGEASDAVSSLDGMRRITGSHKLDGYPVYVKVGYSVDAVLAPWRREIALNLTVAAVVALILFGLARLALAKTRAEATMQDVILAETRQRAEAEAALRQAQKMEALGQLTGGIAHDFNNLLNVVLINLELAAKRLADARRVGAPPADPSKVDGYISGATQGAERGVALTRRLLAFAERQESEPVEVRISRLVFGVLELLGQAAGSQIRITIDCPRTLPAVRVDPNELETALLNLVVNAREAMPEGGRAHIAAREETAPVPGSGRERFVVVSVQDTGRGMDMAMLARATEPFFTTKESGRGSGLGLAMVDRFAAHFGGRLRLDSTPGNGTTAEIWLPAAA